MKRKWITFGRVLHTGVVNFIRNASLAIAAMAVIVFASGGVIGWPQAAVMVPAAALGGWSGVWAARRVPQPVIRVLVVAVGLALTVYYFLKG